MSQLRVGDGYEQTALLFVGSGRVGTRMNRRMFYFLTAVLTHLLALTMVAAAGKDGEAIATQSLRPAEPAVRVALTAAPGCDGPGRHRICRRGDMPRLSRRSGLQGHAARSFVQRAHARVQSGV